MRFKKIISALCAALSALFVAAGIAACASPQSDVGHGTDVPVVTYMVDGRVWQRLEVPDDSVQAPEDPVKEGYDFIGWYEDEYFAVPFVLADYAAQPGRADITVYARFELSLGAGRYEDEYISVSPATEGKKHDDSFYTGYGGSVQTYLYVELTSADLGGAHMVGMPFNFDLGGDEELDFTVGDGLTFVWYEGDWSVPNGAQMFTLGYGSNIQLLAVSDSSSVVRRYLVDLYVLHDYSVKLYADRYSAQPFEELTVIEQQRLPADVPIYETSFGFKGYLAYDEQNDMYISFDRSQPVMSDLKLCQQYEAVQIAADADGGELDEDIVIEPYRKGLYLPVPEKEGYDFLGWRTEDGFFTTASGYMRENMLSDTTDARSLTAVYEAKKYYQISYGEKTQVRPLTVQIAYTDEHTVGEVGSLTYTLGNSPVELDDNNSFSYGDEVTLAGAPDAGDFRFKDESGNVVAGGNIPAWNYAEGQIFVLEYLVSLNGSGVEVPEGLWFAQGDDLQLPQPQREGYIFDGWYTKASPYYSGAEQLEVMPARSFTLYASWMSDEAVGEVDYSLNSDGTLSVSAYLGGEEVVVPEVAGNLSVTAVSGLNPASGVAARVKKITLPETVTEVGRLDRLAALEEVYFLYEGCVQLSQGILAPANDVILYFAGTYSGGTSSKTLYLSVEDTPDIPSGSWAPNNIGIGTEPLKAVTNYLNAPSAQYVKTGGIWYRLTGDSAGVCAFQKGLSGSVSVPAAVEYEGKSYAVTSLDGFAFCDTDQITSITLPEGLVDLDKYAVCKLSGLEELWLPSSASVFEELSVYALPSLSSVHYAGTKLQWTELQKDSNWINGVHNELEFTCADGVLTESEWRGMQA